MGAAEEFLNEFKNLDGVLLKEKKKSLYLLLKKSEVLTGQKEILDQIVAKLTPNNYLEEVFRIEVLIFFRRTQELFDILKNGNDIFRSKIIKQAWFIGDIMEHLSAEQFVKEFLPTISYVVRLKILKNVIKFISDEEKFELIFDYLLDIYGISQALIVLPACSKDKIEKEVKSRRLNLTASQLKILFEKDPMLLFVYFDQKNGRIDSYELRYYPVFKLMALTHPQLYIKFIEKYGIGCSNVGRGTTKKMVGTMKEEIIKAPLKYANFLRNDRLVRNLGDDFPRFFKNALPLNRDYLRYCDASYMLKHYHKCKQYDLFFNAFQEVYKKSLWDFPEYMNDDLLARVPKQADRDKWMVKLEKPKNYLKHYKVEKRVQSMAMDCLMSCESSERTKQFNVLIESIKLCEDYDSLLELLKFVCTRHRNSEAYILNDFLESLDNNFDHEKLKDEHWKQISDIYSILKFKKQTLYTPLFLKYIEFAYKSGIPIKDLVLTYIESACDESLSDFKNSKKDFIKQLIQNYVDLSKEIEDLQLNSLGIRIVASIIHWNKKYPKEKFSISDQPHLISAVKKAVETNSWSGGPEIKALQYVLCTQNENSHPLLKDLEKLYWEKEFECDNITRFYVKYKPGILLEYWKKIPALTCAYGVILNQIKKLSHIELPQKLVQKYLQEIENSPHDKKLPYVELVSILHPSVKYLEFVQKYRPSVDSLDIEKASDQDRDFYNVQCDVAKHLKNITLRDRALSEVFLFSRGDYLKSALTSLYSLLDRTPENELRTYFQNLNKKAISVKKHEIFLTCRLVSVQGVLQKYENELKVNPHPSLQKHLLTSCYKYFKRNPTDDFWRLLKECLKFINGKDSESLKMVSSLQGIPDQYKQEYLEIVWSIYEKYITVDAITIKKEETSLINSINTEDIKLLRWDFCVAVIEPKLFKEHVMDEAYLSFLIQCMIYSGNDAECRVNFAFDILQKFRNKYLNTEESKEVDKVIHNFCVQFYNEVVSADKKKTSRSDSVPKLFEQSWLKYFSDTDTFDEHLMINFMLIKSESKGDIKIISERVSNLFRDVLTKFGDFIYTKFKNSIDSSLQDLLRKDKDTQGEYEDVEETKSNVDHCRFLLNLLEMNDTVPFYLLVVDLLPRKPLGEESEKIYDNIMNQLRTKEVVVQIYLASRLKQT